MAEAKVCDRCGLFYIPETDKVYSIKLMCDKGYDVVGNRTYSTLDLCPDCMDGLLAFLKEEDVARGTD